MKTKRGLWILCLPLAAGAALLAAVLALRGSEPGRGRSASAPAPVLQPTLRAPAPAVAPTPAAPSVATAAAGDARLRGAYQNYRTALATGNRPVQEALAKVLRRDRGAVERLAQEELGRARTPRDREIVHRMLETLGN